MYELTCEVEFSAACYVDQYDGPCQRMHGHNFKVRAYVRGHKIDDTVGMVVDFKEIKKELRRLTEPLDHHILNEKVDFNPTMENLSRYFCKELQKGLQNKGTVYKVTVMENDSNGCSYIIES